MLGQRSEAATAYDRLASFYDEFNAQNDYEVWLGQVLLPELEYHGLLNAINDARERRVLDIGCGTGRAIPPLADRGWQVKGCDISPRMLKMAAAKYPQMNADSFRVADARDLPSYHRDDASAPRLFQLIFALNDVVNYLTQDGDLERAFEGMKRNLAPHGLICFDANTLGLFATSFLTGGCMERGEFSWRGLTEELIKGGTFIAELGGPGVQHQVHRQRHWLPQEVNEALEVTGLRTLALLGQSEDAPGTIPILREPLDEERDYKAIYIVGHHE
ncbi:MAG TPA: class I SAM-dependent methyltransferase [Solirubrobacterales bacterium]|nr:class I SAM-dependent methyltransferase [Solirubrobacterales bacterium]